MTWHLEYIAKFLANPGQNDAAKYGVSITPANRVPDQPYWRVIGIHHLTGTENHGQHHVFCDVLDETGKRIDNARINILTNGKPRGFMVTDKPANEPGTNTQMHWEDTLELYLAGDIPGEHGVGFHTRHEDEEPGTTRGHHSFYMVAQRTVKGGTTPPVEPPPVEEPAPDPTEGFTEFITIHQDERIKVQLVITVKDR